jgi:hypothetical protein
VYSLPVFYILLIPKEKTMNVNILAKSIVKVINECQFSGKYNNELAFENDVYNVLKKHIGDELAIGDNDLDEKIVAHGKTKEEKKRWSKSKVWQDVIIAGCRNTADIVVYFSDKEKIAVQIKYAKNNITSAIQSIIGQSIITSLRFSVVIGIVLVDNRIKAHPADKLKQLKSLLQEKNIFIIVKQAMQ